MFNTVTKRVTVAWNFSVPSPNGWA